MKHIYFVRHGETNANLNEYVPDKHEPLNEQGLIQAGLFAQRVEHLDFDKIIVSEFRRSQQTAEMILKLKNHSPVIEPAFGEMIEPSSLFGVSDKDERVIAHRKNRNANVENPEWRQEDGENFHDIFERIQKAKSILEEDESESMLIVSHAFFIALFTATILVGAKRPTNDWFHIAKTLKVSNTGITLFTVEDGVWRLVLWNDHARFAE